MPQLKLIIFIILLPNNKKKKKLRFGTRDALISSPIHVRSGYACGNNGCIEFVRQNNNE